MGALLDFLQKNQIVKASAPPLCHTSEAYYLKRFMKTGQIEASKCNVFKGEDLSYFFVGRPAFKRELAAEADFWELPICIIMRFDCFRPKRVYPFDSGAFAARRYPQSIGMMEMEEFNVASDIDAAQKIIGTFFINNRNYFNLKARPFSSFESMFDLDVLEEEIHALHNLIGLKNDRADDRRFAIEYQHDQDLNLTSDNVLAVIIPETYLASDKIVEYVTKHLSASLLTYQVYPLRKDYYYYAIYQLVESFMRKRGFFNV